MSEPKGLSRRILRVVLAVLTVAAVVGVIVYAQSRKPPPSKAKPIQARLELAAGDVTVHQAGAEQRAVSGTPLLEGARVRAGAGARALVRLPDGARTFLRSDTAIKLASDKVELEAGEYWLDAPEADRDPLVHQVADVSVSAADAGLSIKRTKDGARVYVARGMAVVTAAGGRVEVNAGEQATVVGKTAPKVAAVAFWDDWTGGMADRASGGVLGAGSGSIYGVDIGAPHGSPPVRMQVKTQRVRAVLRDGLSETSVDQTFFNPAPRPVEGWYWFTVPESASVTGFAVETNGKLVEGEVIEKREASRKYGRAKRSGHAPAILEYVDGLSADLILVSKSGKQELVLGEHTDAAPVGLSASLVGGAELESAELLARLRSLPRVEPLRLQRHDIRFDGKTFAVTIKPAELSASATKAAL